MSFFIFLIWHQARTPCTSSPACCSCRSLAACEQLSRAGYNDIAWINGGFDAARKEDLPVVSAPSLQYGGIGGLSEFLGWTDAQRQNSKSEGFIGGFQNVLKLVCQVLPLNSKSLTACTCQQEMHFWSCHV